AGKYDVCALYPLTGHIRKAYPRDDKRDKPVIGSDGKPIANSEGKPELALNGEAIKNDEGEEIVTNEDDTQTHRVLRRGIPFGEASDSTPGRPRRDARDNRPTSKSLDQGRGLLFLAYQTSIVDQFEFIIQKWVNN